MIKDGRGAYGTEDVKISGCSIIGNSYIVLLYLCTRPCAQIRSSEQKVSWVARKWSLDQRDILEIG